MRLQQTAAALAPTVLALYSLMTAPTANAKVEIVGVAGSSYSVLPSMQSTSPTATPSPTATLTTKIYGGSAGVDLTGIHSTIGAPFDTCTAAGNGFPTLLACNKQAIDGNVVLTISYKADKAGYPILIAPSTTTTGTYVPVQSCPGSPVGAGSIGSISFKWSEICTKMVNGGTGDSGITNNCVTNGSTAATMTFTLGVSSVGCTAQTADIDTGTSVEVYVNSMIGQDATTGKSVTTRCDDTGAGGVCAFSIGNGDGKVILRNLYPGVNFPGGGALPAYAVRLLWAPASGNSDFNAFNSITAAATPDFYRDLLLDQTQQSTPSVSPGRVTGFINEQWYAFKIAVVDMAQNVGYYTDTDSGADRYCALSTGANDETCHFGHPGEVVGVLSKDLTCFVATAAYGSQMAPQVEIFRQFRDMFLKPTAWGAKFVAWYYEHSPKYARMISQSETLRTLARSVLAPALLFAWLSVRFGVAAAIVISALILASISALGYAAAIIAVRERRRRREADCSDV